MWQFRRRRRDLTEQDENELYELFEKVPDLELPYNFREDVAEIFDTAKNRKEAAARLQELREVLANEPDLLEFFTLLRARTIWTFPRENSPLMLWKSGGMPTSQTRNCQPATQNDGER